MAVVPFKRPGKPASKRRGRPAKAGKALSNAGALQHLRVLQSARGGAPIEVASIAELAGMLRWKYPRTHKAVGRWRKNGQAKVEELDNGLSIFVHPDRGALERGRGAGVPKSKAPRQTRRRNPGQMPPEDAPENLDKRMDKTAAEDLENTSTATTSTTSTKPGKSPSASEGYFFSKPAEEQTVKPGSGPDFPAENTTAEAPKIPPALPYGAAPWSATLEGQKLGLFSRSKRASETPPQPAGEGKQPAQVPVAQFGYGYPATAHHPLRSSPHVEKIDWRIQPRSKPPIQSVPEQPPALAEAQPPMDAGKKKVRRSFALTLAAYGFFVLGVAINIWNARTTGGDWLDIGIPVALGVLAEAVLFFMPARMLRLPPGRTMLAVGIYIFVFSFAIVNSLRMASLIAADQAASRADRQTVGVQAAGRALDDARAGRDRACRAGQGKSQACRLAQADVAKVEQAQGAVTSRVAASAKPENADFAALMAWITGGKIQPGLNDFAMLWLLFRTVLPQIGGLVLMVARR